MVRLNLHRLASIRLKAEKNSVPKPYKCSITPRSKAARELIRASVTWESLDEEP